jgi:uncharacterized protein YdeI (YjbR/CyaY-like superfamily)
MQAVFFTEPSEFRAWLADNHDKAQELWVGFYKKSSGKPSLTWPQAVDEALCYGWIDGIRKSIDAESYTNRFTPRKPRSTWSDVNTRRVKELMELGRMQPAGLAAFAKRSEKYTGLYSFEQGAVKLEEAYEKQFKENEKAWQFFQSQPASYQKTATWWVMSAKQEATRLKRLATLIQDSEAGLRIAQLRRNTPSK